MSETSVQRKHISSIKIVDILCFTSLNTLMPFRNCGSARVVRRLDKLLTVKFLVLGKFIFKLPNAPQELISLKK